MNPIFELKPYFFGQQINELSTLISRQLVSRRALSLRYVRREGIERLGEAPLEFARGPTAGEIWISLQHGEVLL